MSAAAKSMLALVGLGLLGACTHAPATITLVLLDGSCSRVNLTAYQDAWTRVVETVADGDRLVLGRVTSDLREFRPDFEHALPAKLALLDNALDRARRIREFDAASKSALTRALDQPCSQNTALLDTFEIAGRLLAADARPTRRLLVFSDMLEDADGVRFIAGLSESRVRQLIEARTTAHRMAALPGVHVHVVGAAAPTPQLAKQVERFWLAYFGAAGASLRPEHYGPVFFGW